MIKTLKNILQKTLWLGMAIFIFNFSIDIPDTYGDEINEDLSYNDIESISELVLEVVLGVENAVPEHDEDDPDDKSGFTKKIDLPNFHRIIAEKESLICSVDIDQGFLQIQSFFKNPDLSSEIKPPQI